MAAENRERMALLLGCGIVLETRMQAEGEIVRRSLAGLGTLVDAEQGATCTEALAALQESMLTTISKATK